MNIMRSAVLLISVTLFGAGCFTSSSQTPVQTDQAATTTSVPTASTTIPAVVTPAKPKTTIKPVAKPPVTQNVVILIKDIGFTPNYIGIMEGDTVVWKNADTKNHTSASNGTLLWDSGNIAPGQTYRHTFPAYGSYSYRDSIGHFNATIIVNQKK
jgi:plastocyanin